MIDILGYIIFALWCFAVYCTTPAAMRLGDDITKVYLFIEEAKNKRRL